MARSDLGAILAAGVEMLKELEHERAAPADAQRAVERLRAARPETAFELAVSRAVGSNRTEYDLLIADSDGDAIAVTVRGDDGTPWLVSFADHWAASFVVTVNSQSVTPQEVLRELELAGDADPGMMRRLVDHVLVAQAMLPEDATASREEMQAAVDSFRRAHGLTRSSDMFAWLDERGLTREEFGSLMMSTVIQRRIRDRIAAPGEAEYFARNAHDFDKITAVEILLPSQRLAEEIVAAARTQGLARALEVVVSGPQAPTLRSSLETSFARDRTPPLRDAAVGELVGPVQHDVQYLVGVVYRRQPARLDQETEEAVRESVFQEWLRNQYEAASIEWHWM